MFNFKSLILLIAFVFLEGCSRKQEGFSNIRIQAPSSKIGSFATIPANRIACYGVSVRGSGITPNAATSCRPETGVVLGFVPDSGVLQGQVPKGTNRTFDVYLYLQAVGQNDPCPSMTNFSSLGSDKIYHIGTTTNINLEADNQTVDIVTTFPGEALNIVVQNSYPSTCIPTVTSGLAGYQVSTAAGTATGAGYILQGKVGRANSGETLTGTGIILKVKE